MGDVGSGFLGFMLGALAIITAETTHISLWSWMILLAIFIGDSTVTLLRRAKSGQKIHQAHRSHAYQILSRKWGSHLKVTLLVLLVNLLWLLPLALFATLWPGVGLLLCFLAYAPLLWVIIRNEAGITDK
jgi:Fuc2NAc and GlcNAc transferase